MIVSWPAGIAARGEIRRQYTHAIDVPATILDVLDIEPPAMFKGVPQEAIAGASFKATFDAPQAAEVRTLQYYELYGSRALYMDGWKAVTFHPVPGVPSDGPGDPNLPFTHDRWELYDTASDFTEVPRPCRTRAGTPADDDRHVVCRSRQIRCVPAPRLQRKAQRPKPAGRRHVYTYWPNTTHIDNEAAVDVRMRPSAS